MPDPTGAAPPTRWAAVVVNYESGRLLVECVRSLLADQSAGAPEVVVVDNGSTDGSVDALREELPAVTVLRPATNLGYSGGANLGIGATTADVVAVCNPDVRVSAGTAAALLARFDAEPDLGAAGPAVREADGSLYPSARSVPSVGDAVGHAVVGPVWPGNPFTRRYHVLDADWGSPRDVDWVSGAAVWLRRRALDEVGGWDARYFMYVEDVDLCWRLQRAGWRVTYDPGGSVVHVQGASTARHPYRMVVEHHRSLLRFAARRWRGWRRILLLPAALFLALRAAVVAAVTALRPRHSADGHRDPASGTAGSTG